MAVTVQMRTEVSQLYVALFGRAPDSEGLGFWVQALGNGTSLTAVADSMYATAPARAYFPTFMTDQEVVASFYVNVLGRPADTEGLAFWTAALNGSTKGAVISQMVANVTNWTPSGNAVLDAAGQLSKNLYVNKVAVAQYYGEHNGTIAGATAILSGVTADVATVAAAKAAVDGAVVAGQTFTLTAGIDTMPGLLGSLGTSSTAGNDTINATETAAAGRVLGGLDVIDGGAGTDTLNVANSQAAAAFTFGGATIKNVETINVSTNGNFGGLDISAIAGLTKFVGTGADTAATTLTAAGTTDVTLNLATTANSTVTGGKAVSVTKGATAGTVGITGKALTEVTVKGGTGVVTIDNLENTVAATSAKGTTMTTVTLDGVDAASNVLGEGLTTLNLKGATTAARTVTITNAKVDHVLAVNVDGTGYLADGTAAQSIVADAAAKTITVNATGAKSSLALTGSTAATTVNITGSAATGALTLGTLNAATVTASTGSGNDSLTLSATAKATVDTGAGNDSVSLASAVAAGSTINLGAGNDKLLFATGGSVAASKTGNTTVIDGGDGMDSVSANLISAGNAAQFKNFELINLDSITGLDLALLTGSTLTGLTMSSASTTATYQNVTKSMGLTVDFVGANTAVNTLSMTGVSGTSDAYTVTFAAAAATTAETSASVQAGTIVAAGIENFNIVSGGVNQWNSLTLGADTSANTVTITGATNLDLAFAGAFGSTTAPLTGVTLIDGSAATGKLAINTTNVVGATAGLAVKGGSANDTITLAQKATVDAGAGNDTIVVSSLGGTITTGAGTDVVNVKAAATGSVSAPVITTITDFTVGTDKLTLADKGTETFTATKVDISTATALFGGTVNALDLAATADATTNAAVKWFQYAGDTYIVQDLSASTTEFTTTDIVVKLTGLVDLSTLAVADFNFA